MPSVHTSSSSGGNVNEVSATVNSRNVPIGGTMVVLNHNESYVVPEGHVLLMNHVTATDGTAGSPAIARFLINDELVAIAGPAEDAAGTNNTAPAGQAIDLRFEAGQSITAKIYRADSGTTIMGGPSSISGYLVDLGTVAVYGDPDFNEPDGEAAWWTSGAVDQNVATGTPVRAIPLGAGQVILIKNNQIDSTTKLLDIETGAETDIYSGDKVFDISDYWYGMGAYQASYSAGKSMVRLIFGLAGSSVNNDHKRGPTELLFEIMSGSAEGDFVVRDLKKVVIFTDSSKGLVSARSQTTYANNDVGWLPLGFAGVDYLVMTKVTFDTTQNGKWTPSDIATANLTTAPATLTTIVNTASSLTTASNNNGWMLGGTTGQSAYDMAIAPARGVRGRSGRLYVWLHTHGDSGVDYATAQFNHFLAVVGSDGALKGSLKTDNVVMDNDYAGEAFAGTLKPHCVMPATLMLTDEADNSERLAAIYAIPLGHDNGGTYDGEVGFAVRQTIFSFTWSGGNVTPAIATNNTKITGGFTSNLGAGSVHRYRNEATSTDDGLGSGYFSAKIGAPNATKFIHLWETTTALTPLDPARPYDHRYRSLFQRHPSQERRTCGVCFGNSVGFFYPTGFWLEKRSRTGLGVLVGTGAVKTSVVNVVQGIASATKVLVVGLDGRYEIVTP